MPTRGIHIATTTYGTWLPRDDRGHGPPRFDLYGNLRQRGHRLNALDAVTRRRARMNRKEPPKRLNDAEQKIVADVITDFRRLEPEPAA